LVASLQFAVLLNGKLATNLKLFIFLNLLSKTEAKMLAQIENLNLLNVFEKLVCQ
jgi:hypothetical protein